MSHFRPGPRNVDFSNRKSAFRDFSTFPKTENHEFQPATFTFLTRKVKVAMSHYQIDHPGPPEVWSSPTFSSFSGRAHFLNRCGDHEKAVLPMLFLVFQRGSDLPGRGRGAKYVLRHGFLGFSWIRGISRIINISLPRTRFATGSIPGKSRNRASDQYGVQIPLVREKCRVRNF